MKNFKIVGLMMVSALVLGFSGQMLGQTKKELVDAMNLYLKATSGSELDDAEVN